MRIAILGGGFAGLAVAWHVIHDSQGSSSIDLFDPEPIGGGASGLSSGLLNPFTGKHARLAWEAENCLKETHQLLTVASQAIAKPLILSKGILRPAITEQQITDFQKTAQTYSDTMWWDKKTCETHVPGLKLPDGGGGLYIKDGLTLDVNTYLNGLWQACAFHGMQYQQMAMINPTILDKYDCILIAMGPQSKNFPLLKDLPISAIKGQLLELKWPVDVQPLPFSLNSQKYIVMSADHSSCFVGSTYERNFNTAKPDEARAAQEIMPEIAVFFPPLAGAKVLSARAAFRATTPNHLPIVGKISDKLFFFTGLGSKGLLYHAWIGKMVAHALLTKDPKHFPEKIHYHLKF